jgi:hypothetical protein
MFPWVLLFVFKFYTLDTQNCLWKMANKLFVMLVICGPFFLWNCEMIEHVCAKWISVNEMCHGLSGVEITTRQLAKCEWNLGLASIFFYLLASLASVFFLLSASLFSPANWVLLLPDSEIQTHTWHGDWIIIMTHTHSHDWSLLWHGIWLHHWTWVIDHFCERFELCLSILRCPYFEGYYSVV